MSYLTLIDSNNNSYDINYAEIQMPINGGWTANLLVNADNPVSGNVTIQVPNDVSDELYPFSLAGTVIENRSGMYLAQFVCRVMAGNAGLGTIVKPRNYTNITASTIVNAILSDCGEILDSSVSQSLLNKIVPSWTIIANKGAIALKALLFYLDPTLSGRFLPNGNYWFGQEIWNDIPDDYPINESWQEADQNIWHLSVVAPYILPGMNIPNIAQVNYIEHSLNNDTMISLVYPNQEPQ